MFDKLTIAKALAKAAVSKLPEGSKAHEVFSRLESIKPEDVGVAAKELLVVATGKGRHIASELAQKAADALSGETITADNPVPAYQELKQAARPVLKVVHVSELAVWNDSHVVTVDGEVIVITSADGREQTRLDLKAAGHAPRQIQNAINTRLHEIVMGKEPK
ncbi:MAG: hypothetical protein ACRCTP_04030 [Aeromonas popoffii]|uniref:hypothetical protein n=1 Tax=Aeromonas popoffii TaxID=70856 RepID=UPI003F366733